MPEASSDLSAILAAQPALFIGLCALLGLMIGSFLNVVIHRVPIMMDNDLRAECAELGRQDAGKNAPAPEASNDAAPEQLSLVREAAPEAHFEAPVETAAEPPGEEHPSGEPGQSGETHPSGESGPQTLAPPVFNIVTPRSACPKCHAPITALQNIPVVSWLALRGKCANCKAPISKRYPLVELATGVLSAYIAWHFGFGMEAFAALAFTWFLIALTMIDFDTQYLPDSLTYPLLWLGLIVSLWHPVWGPGAEPVSPRDSIIGAAGGYLSLWGVYWLFKLLTNKEGMGYGDFKLFAALGAWLGWKMLLLIILLASSMGAVFGIVVMIRQHKGRDTQIAFGPFLAIAGWIALIAGDSIVNGYLGLDWSS